MTVLLCMISFWSPEKGGAFAQLSSGDTQAIRIYQDKRVEELIRKQIKLNELNPEMEGYRIQIFSDSGNNSKTRAQTVMDEFQQKFPEIHVYLAFKSPNYKVKAGDFRSRLDALRFLNQITADYPNSFIISDQINLPQVEP